MLKYFYSAATCTQHETLLCFAYTAWKLTDLREEKNKPQSYVTNMLSVNQKVA